MKSSTGTFWPLEVPPLGHPQHEAALRAWLLSLLPGEVYSHKVLHRHLDVLLHLAAGQLQGSIEGLRAAYATTRSTFASSHPPETVSAALAVVAALGELESRQLEFVLRMIDQRQ